MANPTNSCPPSIGPMRSGTLAKLVGLITTIGLPFATFAQTYSGPCANVQWEFVGGVYALPLAGDGMLKVAPVKKETGEIIYYKISRMAILENNLHPIFDHDELLNVARDKLPGLLTECLNGQFVSPLGKTLKARFVQMMWPPTLDEFGNHYWYTLYEARWVSLPPQKVTVTPSPNPTPVRPKRVFTPRPTPTDEETEKWLREHAAHND